MCGRYAMGIRAAFVRYQLQQNGMEVDDAPDDDAVRLTYNFAPGYYGLVYRADTPPQGARRHEADAEANTEASAENPEDKDHEPADGEPKFKLQAMKWGLVPFWTKRNPDYSSLMKTINARDDSLSENRGMWTSMKKTKRCIVVAEGFYEWLKKNGGRDKLPHYTKRKDGQLMLFAGLWDCVTYQDSPEEHWTYTIITTSVNKQLSFLHDRMPVILENGSDAIQKWLDPKENEWTLELQNLLKPYEGELDCYQVSKDVNKVGNNSPNFTIPIASSENKNNIANFFKTSKGYNKNGKGSDQKEKKGTSAQGQSVPVDHEDDERKTLDVKRSEDNAPMPVPSSAPKSGDKRGPEDDLKESRTTEAAKPEKGSHSPGPVKPPRKKLRSSTTNNTPAAKASDGSQRITNFFSK